MKKCLVWVVGCLMVFYMQFFFCTVSFGGEKNFIIKFGQMEKGAAGYFVANETTTIPLRLRNTGFKFGFTVQHSANRAFYGYKIVYTPAPTIIGPALKENSVSYVGNVIKGKEKKYTGIWQNFFTFDEGDPIGLYKIEIYINGELEKIIDFKVVLEN